MSIRLTQSRTDGNSEMPFNLGPVLARKYQLALPMQLCIFWYRNKPKGRMVGSGGRIFDCGMDGASP